MQAQMGLHKLEWVTCFTVSMLGSDLADEGADELGLKDIAKGAPVEEAKQRFQGALHQGNIG